MDTTFMNTFHIVPGNRNCSNIDRFEMKTKRLLWNLQRGPKHPQNIPPPTGTSDEFSNCMHLELCGKKGSLWQNTPTGTCIHLWYPPPPRARPLVQAMVDKLAEKEAKWGSHLHVTMKTMKEVTELVAQGWVEAYKDRSAKQVQEWMQAGNGIYSLEQSVRNFSAHVPVTERQSVSWGEFRGVLHVSLQSKPGERLVSVWGGGGGSNTHHPKLLEIHLRRAPHTLGGGRWTSRSLPIARAGDSLAVFCLKRNLSSQSDV